MDHYHPYHLPSRGIRFRNYILFLPKLGVSEREKAIVSLVLNMAVDSLAAEEYGLTQAFHRR